VNKRELFSKGSFLSTSFLNSSDGGIGIEKEKEDM